MMASQTPVVISKDDKPELLDRYISREQQRLEIAKIEVKLMAQDKILKESNGLVNDLAKREADHHHSIQKMNYGLGSSTGDLNQTTNRMAEERERLRKAFADAAELQIQNSISGPWTNHSIESLSGQAESISKQLSRLQKRKDNIEKCVKKVADGIQRQEASLESLQQKAKEARTKYLEQMRTNTDLNHCREDLLATWKDNCIEAWDAPFGVVVEKNQHELERRRQVATSLQALHPQLGSESELQSTDNNRSENKNELATWTKESVNEALEYLRVRWMFPTTGAFFSWLDSNGCLKDPFIITTLHSLSKCGTPTQVLQIINDRILSEVRNNSTIGGRVDETNLFRIALVALATKKEADVTRLTESCGPKPTKKVLGKLGLRYRACGLLELIDDGQDISTASRTIAKPRGHRVHYTFDDNSNQRRADTASMALSHDGADAVPRRKKEASGAEVKAVTGKRKATAAVDTLDEDEIAGKKLKRDA